MTDFYFTGVAGAIFSIPGTRWSEEVIELTRLVRIPDCPVPMSRLLAFACHWLKLAKHPLVISFADRTRGHLARSRHDVHFPSAQRSARMKVHIPETDTNFEDVVLTEVRPFKDGKGWHILHGAVGYNGMPSDSPVVPKAGMVARFYGGASPGGEVYGLCLDGVPIFYKDEAQRKAERQAWLDAYNERRRKEEAEPKLPETQIPGFEWTEDMREISGFGGGYERTCRAMVSAGCKWLADHPTADPQFHGFKNVYGVIAEDNDDAKALSKAVTDASGGDCSGAMHHASISHCLFAHKNGWEAYQTEMRKLAKEDAA